MAYKNTGITSSHSRIITVFIIVLAVIACTRILHLVLVSKENFFIDYVLISKTIGHF